MFSSTWIFEQKKLFWHTVRLKGMKLQLTWRVQTMVLGAGLECIRHSKYTSSPSLMLDAFKLRPKRSSAWGASENRSKIFQIIKTSNLNNFLYAAMHFISYHIVLKITQNVAFNFLKWHFCFSPIFVLLKLTFLVTLFGRNFQKLAKLDHF